MKIAKTYKNDRMSKTKAETLKAMGKKIQKLRKALPNNISQEDFASQLGISRVYIGFIEQGRESPSLKLLMKIARKFGVKVEELFSR